MYLKFIHILYIREQDNITTSNQAKHRVKNQSKSGRKQNRETETAIESTYREHSREKQIFHPWILSRWTVTAKPPIFPIVVRRVQRAGGPGAQRP